MAVAKIARVVVSGNIGGSVTWNNVFHFATDTPGVGPGLNISDLLANFALNVIRDTVTPALKEWQPMVSGLAHFNSLSGSSLYPNGAEAASYGLGYDGFSVNPPVPAPCAPLLTWRTAHPGRSGRGRTYICGGVYFSVALSGAGTIAPMAGERTQLTNFGNKMQSYLGVGRVGGTGCPGAWYHVIVSRKLAGYTPPIDPAGVFPVIGFSVPNYWGTMGSRRGGHGI